MYLLLLLFVICPRYYSLKYIRLGIIGIFFLPLDSNFNFWLFFTLENIFKFKKIKNIDKRVKNSRNITVSLFNMSPIFWWPKKWQVYETDGFEKSTAEDLYCLFMGYSKLHTNKVYVKFKWIYIHSSALYQKWLSLQTFIRKDIYTELHQRYSS